jgi:deoxyribodipyrimidine photo-lyase
MKYLKTHQEILDQIDTIDPVEYAKTRNHLGGAVTRLSPYITRGIVTLPQIRDRLHERHNKQDCEKLVQELAWREYFQNVWQAKGEEVFSDIRFQRDDWTHEQLVTALVEAATGVEVIDVGIRELEETGYMHNHLRMWVASVATNLARAHWLTNGKWLYYYLIDGDLASNFLSWQWVAGTSVNKRYTVNQKLINGCSEVKQVRSILTFDRDDMLNQPTPTELTGVTPFTLKTTYPTPEPLNSVAGESVLLYTPWTLNPEWEQATVGRRILVIDPAWFDRFPVSKRVLQFIIKQGKMVVPTLEVFVGNPERITGIKDATQVLALRHPTIETWSVETIEYAPVPKLFPEVAGYYPSFFKYWQQCLCYLK